MAEHVKDYAPDKEGDLSDGHEPDYGHDETREALAQRVRQRPPMAPERVVSPLRMVGPHPGVPWLPGGSPRPKG
ncbi:hypothetical protein [Carbonactinospora thermoautotrophica]|uniref:Uncharacterized protein n=1 Tax=Carbonactinospora thermoautotrophica TaxID=1469144 RepID=A0A132MVF5_9ACTN|nr:hypothetical protein [Carbonactinospora thermoautotrophica]KWX01885.1 hypothetical protein LI90_2918 [Carbonactinospora thermoautotrophica]